MTLPQRPKLRLTTSLNIRAARRIGQRRRFIADAQSLTGAQSFQSPLLTLTLGAIDLRLLLHLGEHPLQDGHADDDPEYPASGHGQSLAAWNVCGGK